jgi:hypothetical protein
MLNISLIYIYFTFVLVDESIVFQMIVSNYAIKINFSILEFLEPVSTVLKFWDNSEIIKVEFILVKNYGSNISWLEIIMVSFVTRI